MAADDLQSAVAAGVLVATDNHRALLQSIVDVARAIFGARAASIMLLDEASDELVFEAVSGEGEDSLVGTRFPATRGIAGWVASSGQPLVIEDVTQDPRFASDQAERTGYIPKGLMAAALLRDEQVLGVLNVLDRPERRRFSVAEMDLLQLFASQAAVALQVLLAARKVGTVLAGEGSSQLAALAKLAAKLDAVPERKRDVATRLITDLDELLG